MKKKKDSVIKDLVYALGLVYRADKLLLFFTLFKNSVEQFFYVFFFVYLTKYVYTCIENGIEYRKLLYFLLAACGGHVVVHFICGWYETYRKIYTPKIYGYIYHKIMDITDKMELLDFENPNYYDIYSKASDRCVDDAMNLSIRFGVFIGNVIASVLSFAIVLSVDWFFAVFLIIPVIVSFYLGKKNGTYNFSREKAITRDKREADYVKRVFYEKRYASEVRLYNLWGILKKKYEKAIKNIEKTTWTYRKKVIVCSSIIFASYSVIAALGAYTYTAVRISMGLTSNVAAYVAVIAAMAFATNQMKFAVENGIGVVNEAKMFSFLRDFLNRSFEHVNGEVTLNSIDTVELKDVSFRYPGSSKDAVSHLNFKWNRGDRVAIVGYNGAGKSTLIKIILGLYPIESGEVLVNGINITELDRIKYRKHFGSVFQDLKVFALPLSENVLMYAPKGEEDYEKAKKALELAQFEVDKAALGNGLDTIVTREFDENGFVCSGGQAQKIAIARVFAEDPEMVIFDEPSSALDPVAEYNMYKNMMHLSESKGVLFVSHRLSSARVADKIYMMKDGRIIEEGTHDELIGNHGEYSKMFILQAQNYQDSVPEEMLQGEKAYYEG